MALFDPETWLRAFVFVVIGVVSMAVLACGVALVSDTTGHDWHATGKLALTEFLIENSFNERAPTKYRTSDGALLTVTRYDLKFNDDALSARDRLLYTAALHGGGSHRTRRLVRLRRRPAVPGAVPAAGTGASRPANGVRAVAACKRRADARPTETAGRPRSPTAAAGEAKASAGACAGDTAHTAGHAAGHARRALVLMAASIGAVAAPSQGASCYERDGHYAKDDPGHRAASAWAGKGAAELGLEGPVDPDTFKAVLEGHVPDGSGRRLGRKTRDGDIQHRPGRDLTFSAPKSVSLTALAGGDTRVVDAHGLAVGRALDWFERNAAETRMKDPRTGRMVRAGTHEDGDRHRHA